MLERSQAWISRLSHLSSHALQRVIPKYVLQLGNDMVLARFSLEYIPSIRYVELLIKTGRQLKTVAKSGLVTIHNNSTPDSSAKAIKPSPSRRSPRASPPIIPLPSSSHGAFLFLTFIQYLFETNDSPNYSHQLIEPLVLTYNNIPLYLSKTFLSP